MSDFEGWIRDQAEMAREEFLGDPGAAVESLAERLARRYPERAGKAYWMDVEGRDDKGVSIRVYERRATTMDLLLGRKSVGGGVFHRVGDRTSRVEVSVGVGAAYWFDDGDWSPVAGVKLRF